jgi:DNA (cytosine-5)-methyltransferase 1
MITFGSLFAGIGGFDLGFERCGMQCKWQVEIDEYATRILERHWPDVHRQRDIKQCGRHNLEPVDVICGGFPCQDISYAGKGAGLDGERSGLFFEAIRLVRELRPRAVVLENVAGLLTRGLDRVLGTLAEIGFDAEWHCIPAAAVGAPHIRDRVFVIAINHRNAGSDDASAKRIIQERQDTESSGGGVLANATGVGERPRQGSRCNGGRNVQLEGTGPRRNADDCGEAGDVADAKRSKREQRREVELQWRRTEKAKQARMGCVENDVADTNGNRGTSGISKRQQRKKGNTKKPNNCRSGWTFQSDWWAVEPEVGELVDGVSGGLVRFAGRVANGIPNRVDKLRCLGNAIVPQVAEVVGRILLERIGGEHDLLRH